jgi:serine/threonine protein kinase
LPEDALIGRTIVGHRLEGLLGQGGMGVVYRARHVQLDRVRALKLLPPQLARDGAFRERFEREWRLAASIEHPNIVEVLDAGEADGHLYIVMRMIAGPDLARLISAEGPLPPDRLLHVFEQISDALDAAHSQGLVHRDVTPRNILVGADDHAYLVDFGVARTTATKGLTKTGFFVGNLDYAAPEQIEGKPIDGRADIYALGGVLYTCLTGHAPYERESDVQLMYAHLHDPPPVPSLVRPDIWPTVDAVVEKAMAKSADDRYASCRELVTALRSALRPPKRETVLASQEARSTVVAATGVETENGEPGKAAMRPAGRLTQGDRIGDYRIERRIGHGGMGVVYLAERPRLGGSVALKILSEELAADERFRDRFVRESQMASSLDHPNIIPVYDAGDADGVFYISMRYVDGPSLKSLLESETLEPMRALSLLAQVGSALDAAHEHGLIHRDVKPANILVASGGASEFGEHIYLTDFGVSKRVESHSGLTGTGQFVGTLSYAAPEQIEGKPVDRRADIYALGCVLYEMLVGKKPFERENDVAVLWAHVTEPPPRLTDERPDLPKGLDAVVQQALAKAPDERYPSCRELVADARAALLKPTAGLPATVVDGLASTAADTDIPAEALVLPAPATVVVASATMADGGRERSTVVTGASESAPARSSGQVAGTSTAKVASAAAVPAAIAVPAEKPSRTDRRRRRLVAAALVLALASIGAALGLIVLGGSDSSQTSPPSLPSPPSPPSAPSGTSGGQKLAGTIGHGRALAGQPFAVRLPVTRTGSASVVKSATVSCPSTLGSTSFAGQPSFAAGVATCRWALLPLGAARESLRGAVVVASGQERLERRFNAVLGTPAEHVVVLSRSTASTPKAGGSFVASAGLGLADGAGHHVPLSVSPREAKCRGRVAQGQFTPGKLTSSSDRVTCAWPVPTSAAGHPVVLQIVVHTSHGTQLVPFSAQIAAAPVSPPAPPPPTTPPSPAPPPPSPPPSTTVPAPVPG